MRTIRRDIAAWTMAWLGVAVASTAGNAAAQSAASQPASAPGADNLSALAAEVSTLDRQLKALSRLDLLLGEAEQARGNAELAAAQAKVQAAQADADAALAAEKLTDLQAQLRAAQKVRDDKTQALLDAAPRYAALKQQADQARQKAAALQADLAKLTLAQVQELAAAQASVDHFNRQTAGLARALWTRAEVAPAYTTADNLYKRYNQARDKNAKVSAAEKALREAKAAYEQALRAAGVASPMGREVAQQAADLTARRDAAQARLADARKAVLGSQEWGWTIEVPAPTKAGQPPKTAPATLWIPPGLKVVRGLLIGHPPVLGSGLTKNATLREACAQAGLGVICFNNLDGLFDYRSDAPQRFLDALAAFAAKSGHPELVNVPWLTIGHSTSGIFCRNVAYWQPTRAIGVIHIKSGNLHQHRPDPAKTLVGVPFVALNGEFEEFGPEGGIRKEYGQQTQWVMIREQLLRWRAQDPAYLVSLVVHAGGGHGDWSDELSTYCAAFIRAAVAARIPADADPTRGVVTCRPLRPEDGWLTDADLTTPTHAPAAYAAYAGDKAKAFWHLDEALARATAALHGERLLLPDPTVQSPVPADWPPAPKPASAPASKPAT